MHPNLRMRRITLLLFFVILCESLHRNSISGNHNHRLFSNNPGTNRDSLIKRSAEFSALAYISLGSLVVFQNSKDDSKTKQLHQEIFDYINNGDSVLEIGIGAGANAEYYPEGIKLTGIDPSVSIELFDRKPYLDKSIDIQLLDASVEFMPIESNSIDVVVSTLVFCTIPNPAQSLQEILRVLKPAGYFISCEHIQDDDDTLLGRQQAFLDPLQQMVAHGCHLNRRTDRLFKSVVKPRGYQDQSSNKCFEEIVEMSTYVLPSQWPISKQVYTVLKK